ncbi:MAG: 5'-methylthioadenosine/adenosylhomocysteine nucleosidase, partial [Treponema sp.]|nr:5'-methylthioadenosine/adenosylhomocysteine nucleosidase [Treponema sp.]
MKKLGIIAAMEVESKIILDALKENGGLKETKAGGTVFYEGSIGSKQIVLARSGVGKVNAALCAQRMILQFGADFIINTGIAGAMGKGLGVLDIVVSSDAVYHDVDATNWGYKIGQIPQMDVYNFEADKKMVAAIQEIFPTLPEAQGHKLAVGRVASGDQFVADKELKARIMQNFNPLCVEMEGAAIAHACHINGVPFVIIRALSDMADDNGEAAYTFNEETAARLSGAILLA